MKKILLINQGNTDNIGDIAIYETISKYFEQSGYKVDFFPFWSEEIVFGKNYNIYPQLLKKIMWHNIGFVDLLNIFAIKRNFKSFDYSAVIIGGGELLSGHPGFNSSLTVWAKILEKKQIPVYLLGVSGDVNMSSDLLKRNKKALNSITKVWVRDALTKEMCWDTYGIKALYSPDVVFAYHAITHKENMQLNKSGLVIVPIEFYNLIRQNLYLEDENAYFEYLEQITMSAWQEKEVINITSSAKTDDSTSYRFYKYLKHKNDIIDINFLHYSNIQNYEEIVLASRKIISGRMHALILGVINDCIVDIIPFKEKLIVFGKDYSNRDVDKKTLEKRVLKTLDELCADIAKRDKNG